MKSYHKWLNELACRNGIISHFLNWHSVKVTVYNYTNNCAYHLVVTQYTITNVYYHTLHTLALEKCHVSKFSAWMYTGVDHLRSYQTLINDYLMRCWRADVHTYALLYSAQQVLNDVMYVDMAYFNNSLKWHNDQSVWSCS